MSRSIVSSSDKALSLLRHLPRISLTNLEKLAEDKKPNGRSRGRKNGFNHNVGDGAKAKQRFPPLGFEQANIPFQKSTPVELSYNHGIHAKRQYPPLSLQRLQLLIDTNRLNPDKPIDLAALCNTKVFSINPDNMHFGVNLTDEGMDLFKTKVNIEVQWASEQSIAAVERNGGTITTGYFDAFSVRALANPLKFFKTGQPIPKRLTPPADLIDYYTDPMNRGYLADPVKVAEERIKLAQKYGYELTNINPEDGTMLIELKDPRQVFYGLQSGWIINLLEKSIYKPLDEDVIKFYSTSE